MDKGYDKLFVQTELWKSGYTHWFG